MARKGKIYQEALGLFDRRTHYPVEDAVNLLKRMPRRKFDETVEVAMRLGVDARHADQQVRGTVVLPHGLGKEVCIAVFAKGEQAVDAEMANADFVGAEELVEKVAGGWTDFDVAIAAPDMMREVGGWGASWGPGGLCPIPRAVPSPRMWAVRFERPRRGV